MLGMDLDLSEEDQMMRAIAMSLGEQVAMAMDTKEEEKKPEAEAEKKEEEKPEKQEPEEPLEKEILDQFTENIMCGMYPVWPKEIHRAPVDCW